MTEHVRGPPCSARWTTALWFVHPRDARSEHADHPSTATASVAQDSVHKIIRTHNNGYYNHQFDG
jgi:hypothetical protein